jgi:hypothetical protein
MVSPLGKCSPPPAPSLIATVAVDQGHRHPLLPAQPDCATACLHHCMSPTAVVAVGWGQDPATGTFFWLIRNSCEWHGPAETRVVWL